MLCHVIYMSHWCLCRTAWYNVLLLDPQVTSVPYLRYSLVTICAQLIHNRLLANSHYTKTLIRLCDVFDAEKESTIQCCTVGSNLRSETLLVASLQFWSYFACETMTYPIIAVTLTFISRSIFKNEGAVLLTVCGII